MHRSLSLERRNLLVRQNAMQRPPKPCDGVERFGRGMVERLPEHSYNTAAPDAGNVRPTGRARPHRKPGEMP